MPLFSMNFKNLTRNQLASLYSSIRVAGMAVDNSKVHISRRDPN
jgi:hypothetical protein